jgi:ABC-type transport system involved in multi-copper enzyme maturation permease subunit
MTTSLTGRTGPPRGRDGLAPLVRAEWTKFRTVRGWVIGLAVAAIVMVLLGLVVSAGSQFGCGGLPGCPPAHPLGPGGEAVTDTFYFVHQPLAANGSLTVRVTSLTGVIFGNEGAAPGQGHPAGGPPPEASRRGSEPWAKAGLMVKASTSPGSAYAAILVTPGHGVRFQYDYTGDTAGLPGAVSAASPRWLRLTRAGSLVTGYDSADGRRWLEVGSATLGPLPATAQAGLFAASPAADQVFGQHIGGSSARIGPTVATAGFDHLSLADGQAGQTWRGDQVGGTVASGYPVADGGFRQSGGAFTVSGSGDIAADGLSASGDGQGMEQTLMGSFAGLIAVIVVAVMFITAEYRRGLIRVTLAASPRRGRVLAAKAVVIAAVAFAAGLAAAVVAVPLGEHLMRAAGMYVYPVTTLTLVRVAAGTAALLAVAAVFALAVGTILRRSAVAVTVVVASIVIPYILAVGMVLPVGVANWLLRVTPAAAFAIQQSIPQYSQAASVCTPSNGCFPLAPWTGFAVLCGYTALALGLALLLLRRADA